MFEVVFGSIILTRSEVHVRGLIFCCRRGPVHTTGSRGIESMCMTSAALKRQDLLARARCLVRR
jgi:hypothetical protein